MPKRNASKRKYSRKVNKKGGSSKRKYTKKGGLKRGGSSKKRYTKKRGAGIFNRLRKSKPSWSTFRRIFSRKPKTEEELESRFNKCSGKCDVYTIDNLEYNFPIEWRDNRKRKGTFMENAKKDCNEKCVNKCVKMGTSIRLSEDAEQTKVAEQTEEGENTFNICKKRLRLLEEIEKLVYMDKNTKKIYKTYTLEELNKKKNTFETWQNDVIGNIQTKKNISDKYTKDQLKKKTIEELHTILSGL